MRILITDGMNAAAIEELRQRGHEITEKFYAPEELGQALYEHDCVIVRSKTKVREPHLRRGAEGRLKLVIRGGVGVDNIDVAAAESLGVSVRNTPNASSASVAELALGHMFALARYIGISKATMAQGQWNKKQYEGVEIGGKTLGIIGMGRIARELAKRAEALGMTVIYTCRSGPKEDCPYTYLTLDELLSQADFVSLHIPMPADRQPVLGRRELALMKPTAFLVNTARGGVVDEAALLAALDAGVIAGAALDVFAEEPTANQALCAHPKTVVTPHIGGQTAEAQERIGKEIVSIVNSFCPPIK